MNQETFDSIVRNRRSNRRFDPNIHVPKEVMQRSLERAILSPNSSNMQLWEFYWIQQEEEKKKYYEFCLHQSAAKTADQIVVFVTRQDLWKSRTQWHLENIKNAIGNQEPTKLQQRGLGYYGKLMPMVYRTDLLGLNTLLRKVVCFFGGLFKPFMRLGGKADQRVMVHKSCALAAQTFMLSISAEGFDTCPMEGFDKNRVRKSLGLPSSAEINMIIAVGKGTPEGIYGDRTRLPFEDVVFER